MNYLSIDPGYKNTAYSILEIANNGIGCIDYQHIKIPDEVQPLSYINAFLQKLVLQYDPVSISVESVFWGFNVDSAIKTAKVIGIIELLANQHNLPYHEINPSQLKKFITGNGRADKKLMKECVLNQLAYYPEDLPTIPAVRLDHIIDSVAVGIYTINHK